MELMVAYVIGVIIVMLIGGSQMVAATVAGYRQGGVIRDPVPVVYGTVHTGEFLALSQVATHTPGNCESCGSQEFRTHRGVDICSYCRSVK